VKLEKVRLYPVWAVILSVLMAVVLGSSLAYRTSEESFYTTPLGFVFALTLVVVAGAVGSLMDRRTARMDLSELVHELEAKREHAAAEYLVVFSSLAKNNQGEINNSLIIPGVISLVERSKSKDPRVAEVGRLELLNVINMLTSRKDIMPT